MIIENDSKREFNDISGSFSALWYFQLQGEGVHDRLTWIQKNLNHKDANDKIEITKTKSLVKIVILTDRKIKDRHIKLQSFYTFDLDRGGNVVEFGSKGGTVDGINRRKYEKVNGVWVPIQANFVMDNKNTGIRDEITVTWKKNIVNGLVPPSDFEPERIGGSEGSEGRDRRTGQNYIYKKKKEK